MVRYIVDTLLGKTSSIRQLLVSIVSYFRISELLQILASQRTTEVTHPTRHTTVLDIAQQGFFKCRLGYACV